MELGLRLCFNHKNVALLIYTILYFDLFFEVSLWILLFLDSMQMFSDMRLRFSIFRATILKFAEVVDNF